MQSFIKILIFTYAGIVKSIIEDDLVLKVWKYLKYYCFLVAVDWKLGIGN